MIYLSITQVDADTGIVCTKEPMRTGPSFPQIKNCTLFWANQSKWPISTTLEGAHSEAPLFFGTCDDDADILIEGVISTYSEEEYKFLKNEEHQARKPYESWIGNEELMTWDPPVAYPDDGKFYNWNEETQLWDLHLGYSQN